MAKACGDDEGAEAARVSTAVREAVRRVETDECAAVLRPAARFQLQQRQTTRRVGIAPKLEASGVEVLTTE